MDYCLNFLIKVIGNMSCKIFIFRVVKFKLIFAVRKNHRCILIMSQIVPRIVAKLETMEPHRRITTNLETMEPHHNVKDRYLRNRRRFIEVIWRIDVANMRNGKRCINWYTSSMIHKRVTRYMKWVFPSPQSWAWCSRKIS